MDFKIKSLSIFIFTVIVSVGCTSKNKPTNVIPFYSFTSIDPQFENNDSIYLPKGYKYEVLFSANDSIQLSNKKFNFAKSNNDLLVFVPQTDSSGLLYIGHETKDKSSNLGMGGGGTILPIIKKDNKWVKSGIASHVDFSMVGETINNCGGKLSPTGTIMSAEEFYTINNKDLYPSFPDTSDWKKHPRYQNFGWIVEIDPINKKATQKIYNFGRFKHEDLFFDEDQKTVYITNDDTPACFFKFVCDKPNDYSIGQLFAFQERNQKNPWIALPMEYDSLAQCREIAIKKGATLFIRHEWITKKEQYLYISETGADTFDISNSIQSGGQPASYFNQLADSKHQHVYHDPYGRILQFDTKNNTVKSYLEGGSLDSTHQTNLASPDGLALYTSQQHSYLVVHEDLTSNQFGKAIGNPLKENYELSEVYFTPIQDKVSLTDIKRFLVAPRGAEATGGIFSPDGQTFFVCIQHPDPTNKPPFHQSCVIAISRQ